MVHRQVGGGEGCVILPALFPSWLDTFFFLIVYFLLEDITKTRHTEGSHLVMNTEVS